MSNYGRFIEPPRRGVLLAILHQSGVQGASVPVLASVAHQAGYTASREVIEADLVAMSDLGLVIVRTVGTIKLATIEQRGVDVATGQTHVPSIERADEL